MAFGVCQCRFVCCSVRATVPQQAPASVAPSPHWNRPRTARVPPDPPAPAPRPSVIAQRCAVGLAAFGAPDDEIASRPPPGPPAGPLTMWAAIVVVSAVGLAAALPSPFVMPWMCLERCGDNATQIAFQLTQFAANSSVLNAASFEDFNLGPKSVRGVWGLGSGVWVLSTACHQCLVCARARVWCAPCSSTLIVNNLTHVRCGQGVGGMGVVYW